MAIGWIYRQADEDDGVKALETSSPKHAPRRRWSSHQIRFCRSSQGLHEFPTDRFNLNKEADIDISLVLLIQCILKQSSGSQ
ncbi:hypothetical protein BS47DRAFT_1402605 [Hydnum rufescens UP504]|uniref:Uncharacterized protein n=1 Tax=Hydnum rufescens UP504 TaxID=1448309 RepID=A0A9P6AC29_9AGAM|nr:hypothetical protein BS47DRAFT_1402605 [Hydnum rufescens UP504]